MQRPERWLQGILVVVIFRLADGNRISRPLWAPSTVPAVQPLAADSNNCCGEHVPLVSRPERCTCHESLQHNSSLAADGARDPHMSTKQLNDMQSRRLLAYSQIPLRVSHNHSSQDLVALSHSPQQGGSRLKTNSHLQRLGGGTPNPLERMLIVAHYRENLSWLQHVSYLPSIIYQADNASASHKVVRNMGETAAYLQYIVDHYDVLPKQMAFVHAHRKAKHMPDIVPVLQVMLGSHISCQLSELLFLTVEEARAHLESLPLPECPPGKFSWAVQEKRK